MIPRSTIIATAAILLSLLVHFVGLGFSVRNPPRPAVKDAATDVVTLGNAFEDIAQAPAKPVPPEPAPEPVPDPPVKPQPQPERAEIPTSRALVASPDPQNSPMPDTGSATAVQPETIQSVEPETGKAPVPATTKPSGGNDTATADVAVSPPKGTPDTAPAPPSPAPDLPVGSAPQPPTLPVAALPEAATIPVIALKGETIDPETPEFSVAPVPDDPEPADANGVTGGSDLAVVSSLRPRLPRRRPSADPSGAPNGAETQDDLLLTPSQLIESPLTAYRRDGIDLFAGSRSSDAGTRGAGNSDVTNYDGQVLTHLNRAPVVHVSGKGVARVTFQINPDGTLAWVDVIDSSGSQMIDSAAKAQVRIAAPFPPPPNGASRKLVFVYRIN